MRTPVSLLLVLLFCSAQRIAACTSFIVSGRVTPDGRPILFKNRDTDQLNNALAYFTDGKYRYIGLVNADTTWSSMVWGGFNEAGFCIINTAAYNNNIGDTTKLIDLEGVLMKLALQNCRTLADFENLLDTLRKPMGVDANFGVIDALGGAAYYETGNYRYVKFDANDTTVAPDGVLIRTNYSFTGDSTVGYGYIRYRTAENFMNTAIEQNNYSHQYLLNGVARNLSHSLTSTNLLSNIPKSGTTADFRFFNDYISRSSTSSAIMLVGTPNGNSTAQTTMWTILGLPLVSVPIPVWITPNGQLPKVLSMGNSHTSSLCSAALKLRNRCFSINRGSGGNYINLSAIVNEQGTGTMQLLKPIEDEIFSRTNSMVGKGGLTQKAIQKYYAWIDRYLQKEYMKLFNIELGC